MEVILLHAHGPVLAISHNLSYAWLRFIGSYHFIFLHFPIALITVTLLAEWLFIYDPKPLFSNAARFMLASAALLISSHRSLRSYRLC